MAAPPCRPPSALLVLACAALLACGGPAGDRPYDSPAQTFRTYVHALEQGDAEGVWQCYSASYRAQILAGDRAGWEAGFRQRLADLRHTEQRREIAQERVINPRLAYLLFDRTTLTGAGDSPFFYFLREPEGWKITSHLDTVFHAELERAIERGEYRLPAAHGD